MNNTERKHPKALYTLFATEMWERFSYYGMRAILTLYLAAELVTGGFGLPREQALAVYALFTGLVYLTPILGGWVADKFLGKRKTVYIGGLVMAVGQFLLATSAFGYLWGWDLHTRMMIFNLGLGILIIGNGFFKPNISTIVGDYYDDNDPLKDSAFNIFYMGINLGAIMGPFIAGYLGEEVFWGWGYFSAGIGMLLGVLWLKLHEYTLGDKGLPPGRKGAQVLNTKDWMEIFIYALLLIFITIAIIFIWHKLPDSVTSRIVSWGFGALFIGISYVIIRGLETGESWRKKFYTVVAIVVGILLLNELGVFAHMSIQAKKYLLITTALLILAGLILMLRSKHTGWSRMGVIITLAIFNVAFWAGFEQAGGTFSLFAKNNTNRQLHPIWIPSFLKAIPLKYYGFAALFFLIVLIYAIYVKIYSDDPQIQQKIRPIYKAGLHGTITFSVLAIWYFLSDGPEIPASWFQNVNPIAILIFAPLFSVMWLKLDKWGINPRTSIKFALGLLLGAIAFLVMTKAQQIANTGVKVSPMWLVTVYVILTLGELMLSPIGLSMITKLADAKMVSVVMGLWMASFAAGNYLAGILESLMHSLHKLGLHIGLYPFIASVDFISAVILILLSPLLNKAMKGIH
jgi:POT family proton-dependent oligopeptide transporter